MTCSQCGQPATSKRDDVYYCGACSVELDWQQLIRMVQDAPTPATSGVAAITRSA